MGESSHKVCEKKWEEKCPGLGKGRRRDGGVGGPGRKMGGDLGLRPREEDKRKASASTGFLLLTSQSCSVLQTDPFVLVHPSAWPLLTLSCTPPHASLPPLLWSTCDSIALRLAAPGPLPSVSDPLRASTCPLINCSSLLVSHFTLCG